MFGTELAKILSFFAKHKKSAPPMDANFPFENFVVLPGFENDCLLPNWLFFQEFLKKSGESAKKTAYRHREIRRRESSFIYPPGGLPRPKNDSLGGVQSRFEPLLACGWTILHLCSRVGCVGLRWCYWCRCGGTAVRIT